MSPHQYGCQKSCEPADIFNLRYGNICYAGIHCDSEFKYPRGSGRVTFSSQVSFTSAVYCRFLKVTYGDVEKRLEVKPYLLDDQVCDECHGLHCSGCYTPYFCGSVHCLRYYCEHCWAAVHSAPSTQHHHCFKKEDWAMKFLEVSLTNFRWSREDDMVRGWHSYTNTYHWWSTCFSEKKTNMLFWHSWGC